MKAKHRNSGTALLMTVFVVALLSAVTMGILQINTVDTQIMGNQIYAVEALMIANAGLNDAYAEIRDDADWCDGFTSKSFGGGSYTVVVTDETSTPPSRTDEELEVEALGALYPGVMRDVAAHHPDLDDDDFDSRAKITINAGSYSYTGGMSGNPFSVSIPIDATQVRITIVLKKLDYPEIPANVNCIVSWEIDGDGSTSMTPTIVSEGTNAQGFVARMAADITVGQSAPHKITVNAVRINE